MDVKTLKTPCYVFDERELIDKVGTIREIISSWGGKTCFAIKANPFLIPYLLPIVDKFEVCSPGELEICRNYNVPGEKILFSGVVKSKRDIQTALEYSVDTITLESLTHWKLLKECLEESHNITMVKILPRLSSGAQFGMEEEQIFQIVEEQQRMDNVILEGIHYFTGTQKKGNKYVKEIEKASFVIKEIEEKYGEKDLILEYGPGLAVPYFTGDDFESSFISIEEMREFILGADYPFRIDIELGRYMAASCGTYYTRVVDVKSADGRNYCLVDGGIHQVNYYGSNMAMRTPIIRHIQTVEESKDIEDQEYMICGSLCTFADVLARGITLHNPRIGDILKFENIGAYSVTEGTYLFLSRDLPSIYMERNGGEVIEIRKSYSSYKINMGE